MNKEINLNRLQKIKNKKGIYLLYKNEELVYIGISSDIYSRVLEHIAENKKDFDSVKNICSQDNLDNEFFEVYYIDKMKPEYNKLNAGNFFNFFYSIPYSLKKSCRDYDQYIKIFKSADKYISSLDYIYIAKDIHNDTSV